MSTTRSAPSTKSHGGAWLVALFGVLLALVCTTSCASAEDDEGPLWADPGVVRLDSAQTRVSVRVHNRSGTVRPIGNFMLSGEDWDTVRFADESFPRTVPGLGAVTIDIQLSATSLEIEPGVYRSATATLGFASDQFEYAVPIEFAGTAARPRPGPLLLGAAGLLALLGLCAWEPLRAGLGSPRVVGVGSAQLGVAGVVAGLLTAAATIPVGLGVCRARLDAPVGPVELEQCRAGRGGGELVALAASPGIWWWLISVAVAAAALVVVRSSSRPRARLGPLAALAGLRVFGLALILAALVGGLAPEDTSLTSLVVTQAELTTLAGLTLPRWGLVAQPLGLVLGLVLIASAGPLARALDPVEAALERLEDLVWSAVLVSAFLGGPTLPGLSERAVPLLEHGARISVELLGFGLKLALVLVVVARVRAYLVEREVGLDELVRAHARWTIPLALVQVLGVLIWSL